MDDNLFANVPFTANDGSFFFRAWQQKLAADNKLVKAAQESGQQLTTAQAQEAMSDKTFQGYATYLVHRLLTKSFNAVPSINYRLVTDVQPAMDFRKTQFFRWGVMGELLEVLDGGQVRDTTFTEIESGSGQVKTYERFFSIGRKVFYDNDIRLFQQIPIEMGRQAGRLRTKIAIVAGIINNPNLADGRALFNGTDGNLGSVTLTRDITGANALVAGYDAAIAGAKDTSGEPLGYGPTYLMVPKSIEAQAKFLLETPMFGSATPNPAFGLPLTVIVEPGITTHSWFLLPDKDVDPVVVSLFLLGNDTPTILQEMVGGVPITGGQQEQFAFVNNDMRWKVREDVGAATISRRASYGAYAA